MAGVPDASVVAGGQRGTIRLPFGQVNQLAELEWRLGVRWL
jgi:hypothetical protein